MDAPDIQMQIEQLRQDPAFAGMSDDQLRQMVMMETTVMPSSTGEFTVPIYNPYGDSDASIYLNMPSKRPEQPMMKGAMETVTQANKFVKSATGNNIIGPNFLGKAKNFLGLTKSINPLDMDGDGVPNLLDPNSANPVGTKGLSSILSGIKGLGGGAGAGAGTGMGAALSAALPVAAVAGLALYARSRKKKKRERRKQMEAEQYAERQQQQRQDLIDSNLDYYEQANKFTNPYGLK